MTVCGDAASAVICSKEKAGNQLVHSNTHIYGQHAKGIWQTKELSREAEKTYPERLAKVILDTVKDAGYNLDDIALIAPHTPNTFSWRRVSKLLGFPMEKIFLQEISNTGHCFGVDTIFNWKIAWEQGYLPKESLVLLASAGLGLFFLQLYFVRGRFYDSPCSTLSFNG